MRASDFEVRNHDKLDGILTELCSLVIQGQQKSQDLGMVAAAVLDTDNNCVVGINYPAKDGKRVHAERAAIDSYHARFGEIPAGSIIITTCSPCTQHMEERHSINCSDLIDEVGVHKVYAGYQDPTQDPNKKRYHIEITRNPKIHKLCERFAETFLDEELNELSFLGSPCTKDCSGHRAGYEWSQRRGGKVPYSPSQSFNNGAALQRAGIVEDAEPKVQQAQRDGLDLTAHRYRNELTIDADTHGRNLARVVFDVVGQNLIARDLLVDERYRGQGIAASIYDWAKELGYRVKRSTDQTDAGKAFWDKNRGEEGQVWESKLDEIARLPKKDAGDFGEKGTITAPKYAVKKKPLPGGSQFTYAVNRTGKGDIEIMIFDGEEIAAELDLFETQDVTGAWRVETVVVDPDYRGQGLGKALYGIALSILKLTIEAGDTQTRHGQQMWLMLNSIPGVEVMGYNMEPTDKYQPRPGDKIIKQDADWTRYTFPVKPGSTSMRSGRRGTGIYTSQASMIARWTGR